MRRKNRRSFRTLSPEHRRAFRPALGWLEARTLLSGNPTYYTVSLTTDTGASSGTDATTGDPSGDLLWAIEQANVNTNPCGSVINFDPTVFATAQTITLSSTLELSESPGPEVVDATGVAGTVMISGNNAVGVFQVDGGVTASLNGLTITAGSTGSGGGILNEGNLTVSDCTISDNTADGDGGGISNAGTITVTGTSFSGDQSISTNCCNGFGAGLFNTGTGTITNSTFTGNSMGFNGGSNGSGGGLFNSGGSLIVSACTFSGNTANVSGGGVGNSGGTMTLSNSTLSGNSAGSSGGGIFNGGSLTVSGCTVSANSTYGGVAFGGGIDQAGGTLELINSTVAGNDAGTGGGIYDSANGLTVINSTIAYNQDGGGAPAGIDNAGGSPILDNTIVAWNTVFSGGLNPPELDTGGTPFTSTSAYNLIGVDTTGSFSGNGNLLGVTNAGLGILADNGGPTQTVALLAGSPAIDAGSVALAVDQNGNPLTTDQRGNGYPRVVNGTVDIGAFQGPTTIGSPTVYTVNLTSANGTGSGNSGDLVYVIGQADANVNPAGSVVQFDPTVFATPQTITLSSPLQLAEPSGPLLIDGPGAGLVTISGNNAMEVVDVASGAVATLSGLTISGGSTGIVAQEFSTLTASGSTISGNGEGGIANAGNLSLVDSAVSANTGGGLNNLGTATVTGSTFAADDGGGIANYGGAGGLRQQFHRRCGRRRRRRDQQRRHDHGDGDQLQRRPVDQHQLLQRIRRGPLQHRDRDDHE